MSTLQTSDWVQLLCRWLCTGNKHFCKPLKILQISVIFIWIYQFSLEHRYCVAGHSHANSRLALALTTSRLSVCSAIKNSLNESTFSFRDVLFCSHLIFVVSRLLVGFCHVQWNLTLAVNLHFLLVLHTNGSALLGSLLWSQGIKPCI